MDDIENAVHEGLHGMALELRALNVDEVDKPAVAELADSIEKSLQVEAIEERMQAIMFLFMSALTSSQIPVLAKMTIGRMISELNLKLIERMQGDGLA